MNATPRTDAEASDGWTGDALAFKYRRKVFFNPRAGALNEAQFVAAVRRLCAKETSKP